MRSGRPLIPGPTAIELSNRDATFRLLPLIARHERGEGWGEENPNKNSPPLPGPLLPSEGKRGRRATVTCFFGLLNSMPVGSSFPATWFTRLIGSKHRTLNIQHPTSNIQRPTLNGKHAFGSRLKVRCWMLDVRISMFPRPIGWGWGEGEGFVQLNSHGFVLGTKGNV
jgi:hypothetical protein